jgi:hypothetical protein
MSITVLVDTSVWIDYFRSGDNSTKLDFLIDENLIATNDLILAELVPFLMVRHQEKVIDLLYSVKKGLRQKCGSTQFITPPPPCPPPEGEEKQGASSSKRAQKHRVSPPSRGRQEGDGVMGVVGTSI